MKKTFLLLLVFALLGVLHITSEVPQDAGISDEISAYTDVSQGEILSGSEELSIPSRPPFSEVEMNTSVCGLNYMLLSRVKKSQSTRFLHFLRSIRLDSPRFMSGLPQEREQLCTTTFIFSSRPACEYYVYALRHILI